MGKYKERSKIGLYAVTRLIRMYSQAVLNELEDMEDVKVVRTNLISDMQMILC